MSKDIFNIYILYYYYHTLLLRKLLNFTHPGLTVRFFGRLLQKKYYRVSSLERTVVSSFYYTASAWCILTVRILALPPLDPKQFWLKRLKKKSAIVLLGLVRLPKRIIR